MRRSGLVMAGLAICAIALGLGPGPALSQDVRPVLVTNWPETQEVRGTVEIDAPVRLSRLVEFSDILVPPVAPSDTTRLVDAGTLESGGFAHVVLSLHGQVKGSVSRTGEIGAILVPDVASVQNAFNELGLVHFGLAVRSSEVSASTAYFASDQPRYVVGFGKYRVLLFNTTDKSVNAAVFAYLTN